MVLAGALLAAATLAAAPDSPRLSVSLTGGPVAHTALGFPPGVGGHLEVAGYATPSLQVTAALGGAWQGAAASHPLYRSVTAFSVLPLLGLRYSPLTGAPVRPWASVAGSLLEVVDFSHNVPQSLPSLPIALVAEAAVGVDAPFGGDPFGPCATVHLRGRLPLSPLSRWEDLTSLSLAAGVRLHLW